MPVVERSGEAPRSFDGSLDLGGINAGKGLFQRGVIALLEKHELGGLREDQGGSIEITQGAHAHARGHIGPGGVLDALVNQLLEEFEPLVDGDPFQCPEQCYQQGRPTWFRETCQSDRSHLAGRACETLDYRLGRAWRTLWCEVHRADRVDPLQMRHELAGCETSRCTAQLLDRRRAVVTLEQTCDARELHRVERTRHVVPASLLNASTDAGTQPFQGAHAGQQHLVGEDLGHRALHQ